MKPADKGYYRPFNQTKRDCKRCRNYIIKVIHRGEGQEYMRCKLQLVILFVVWQSGDYP